MEKKHNRMAYMIVVLAIIGASILAGCGNRLRYSYQIEIYTGAGGFGTRSVIKDYTNEYVWDGLVLTYTDEDGQEVTIITEGHLVRIREGSFCPF